MISEPSIWGKLPAFGDFIRHRATVEDTTAWQTWLEGVGSPALAEAYPLSRRCGEPSWLQLTPNPSPDIATPVSTPWSFDFAPEVVPMGPESYLIGALVDSTDKVGRRHPLIAYQKVGRRWLEQHLDDARGWLFWLARLVAHHVANPSPLISFTQQVDQLWELHRPRWQERFGLPSRQPDMRLCRAILQASGGTDAAVNLVGVGGLPWHDWPQCVWEGRVRMSFWRQDLTGRFVDATRRVPSEATRMARGI